MDVRLARPSEYERVGDLVVAAYRALPGGHLSGDYAAVLADVESRAGEAEVLVALLGDDDDVLVGSVTFVADASSRYAEHLEPGEAGVRMLAVAPRAQRRGVGRALVEACIRRAKELQRTALILHTTPWMTAAHSLYEASGFDRFPDRDWAPVAEVPLLAYRFVLN
jgi:GNAT superfamily N-acetyltransferase